MGKQTQTSPVLLRWSEHLPASDVQDPLGLGLRGSARLSSRLLYCITSVTPRARYFSFIPWCVFNYRQHEEGKPFALGLRDAIILREQALTSACIVHHGGKPCGGGALVGSQSAQKWFARGEKGANFRRLKFAKNPALSAYFNSIVNLGFFATESELPDTDEESNVQESTFDDIELSDLGLDLAKRYDSVVGKLAVTKRIATKDRSTSLASLAEFGNHGGLCELSHKGAADRELLQNVFFALVASKGDSHRIRRQSLLLILELCRQFSANQWVSRETEFGGAVYYGEVANEEYRLNVVVPKQLIDIATRWRMFYFHHFMGVALEGLFSWLVSQLANCGLAGTTVEALVARLDESSVKKNLSEILQVNLKTSFGESSPSNLFAGIGLSKGDLDVHFSKSLDKTVRSLATFAEDSLEDTIRSKEHVYASTGLALPMVLLATTLGRFMQWEVTNYGKWLASAASDPYLDLVPPLVTSGLSRRFGNWWKCTWRELASFVLSRYVILQHQSMSYEKTFTGDRCLLQVDGPRVVSTGNYDEIGMTNPRLRSALQILKDLGMMEDDDDGITHLTTDGKQFLKRELVKEAENEVS
ncbi:MAG: hypothetical protein FJ123_06175 [Deltaproteobacteria bacterium]|nr:hypothetical protein [Deltaproteobacteria bacterium]